MVCKYCNSESLYLKRKGSSIGLYCFHSYCNKWQKWVGKKELKELQARGMPLFSEEEQPMLIGSTGQGAQNHQTITYDALPETMRSSEGYSNKHETPYQSENTFTGREYYPSEELVTSPPVQKQKEAFCITCTSGIIPTLSPTDDYVIRMNTQERLVSVGESTTGYILTAVKVNFCPTCGKSLKE